MFSKTATRISLCGALLSAIPATAQEPVSPTRQWGVRADAFVNDNYTYLMNSLGVTCKASKHAFYGGVLTGFFTPDTRSPLTGAYFSYQYFPFSERTCFNPYAFVSSDLGRFTTNRDVEYLTDPDAASTTSATQTTRRFNMNHTIGAGFETRFGDHLYSHFSIGAALASFKAAYDIRFTEPSTVPGPNTSESSRTYFSGEVKLGLGYYF